MSGMRDDNGNDLPMEFRGGNTGQVIINAGCQGFWISRIPSPSNGRGPKIKVIHIFIVALMKIKTPRKKRGVNGMFWFMEFDMC